MLRRRAAVWWCITALLTLTGAAAPLSAQNIDPSEPPRPAADPAVDVAATDEETVVEDETAEEEADDGSVRIRELTQQLTDKDAAEDAVRELIAIGNDHVDTVFLHIEQRSLAVWDGRIVFIGGYGQDDAGNKLAVIYDLLTPEPDPEAEDDAAMIVDEPLATLPRRELGTFREDRQARRRILKARALIKLQSADKNKRIAAAKRAGDTRNLSALDKLRQLAATDPNWKARHTARESADLIVASGLSPDATPESALDAAADLGEIKSIRGMSLLLQLTADPDATPEARQVYAAAIAKIERHKTFTDWVSHLFRGFSLGTILILIALGLAITFGMMGVINMAHGEMLMIGAVATWACFEFISPHLPPAWFDWYYVIAFPVAFGCAAFVGWLTEVTIVRFLYKRPLDSLLATIGVSFILIQGVRLWKGDNLGMRHPSWAVGGWEIMLDVILPYNRLFLIALTATCLVSVVVIFRFTRIGLMMRATVQNREMAQSLGVNTRLVDMFTFAYGAGLAGLAGYGIFLTSNPTPEMGQGYIVKAFLVVVVGGVGNLLGVIVSGLGLGFLEKLIEPIVLFEDPFRLFDAGWATVAVLIVVVWFIQRRPAGLFPDKGRLADQASRAEMPWLADAGSRRRTDYILGSVLMVVGLIVVPLLYATGVMSPAMLNKLGQYLAFALIAIGLDLIWGYAGVLSLCQCLFFALGGYCMGFYLVNHGPRDQFGIPECLAYVMSDVTDKTPPWYLDFFHNFPISILLGMLIAGGVAFVIGVTTFRSRVRGVYFAILTQAILVAFWNVFVKNDMKLGGTNGLTRFTHVLGFRIQDKPFPARGGFDSTGAYMWEYAGVALTQTRFWMYITSLVVVIGAIVISRLLVSSRFGRVLVAIRDDETRLRFVGYQTWIFKTAVFVLAGMLAAAGGMLFVPQKGIITPKFMEPFWSIMVVVWVALGGRSTLWGAVIGTIGVSMLYDWMTSFAPDYWKLVLGGLFIAVPLLLPGGLMSLPQLLRAGLGRFRVRRQLHVEPARVAEGGAS